MIATAPKDFAFVPQRTTGSRSDDRKFINTHLSRLAAERRRRGKPRIETLSPISSSPSSAEKPVRRHKQSRSESWYDVPSAAQSSPLPRSVAKAYHNDAVLEVAVPSPPRRSVALPIQSTRSKDSLPLGQPFFLNGASIPGSPSGSSHDPFQSTVILVDELTKPLLDFSSDVFVPWIDGMEMGQDKTAAYSNKFHRYTEDLLQDRTTGYATLARLAIVASVAMHSPQASVVAVGLKSKAYESLRVQLSNQNLDPDFLVLTKIFALLSMEVADRNLEASSVHAKVLQKLVYRSTMNTVTVDDSLIRSILWHECLRGSFSLGRPIFDIESLVDHKTLRGCLNSVGDELYSVGLMLKGRPFEFDNCKLPTDVLELVTEFRFMSDLSCALKQEPSKITAEVMSAFTYRATSISSNLLALFNDTQDALSGDNLASEQDLYTIGAVCLAARFWYRCATSHEMVDSECRKGSEVFLVYGTQQLTMEKLREAFERCQLLGAVPLCPRLWLWILYVGTLGERANMSLQKHSDSQQGMVFKHHFANLALKMGYRSWDAVEQVLSTFLYSSEVGTRSRGFFEESMREIQNE